MTTPEQAPSNTLDKYLEGRLADEYRRLNARLHACCQHPDFEYATTELPRLSGVAPLPPKGHGWVVNAEKGRDGWERFDYTEETYWRRLKSEAAKDTLLPFELPPVEMKPLHHKELVTLLAERLNKTYMPEHPELELSKERPEFNSKPYYLSLRDIQNLTRGSGCYSFLKGALDSAQDERILEEPALKALFEGTDSARLFAGFAFPKLQILVAVDRKEDFFPAIVRCANDAGYWSEWVAFSQEHDFPLHLDRIALTEHLDTYF